MSATPNPPHRRMNTAQQVTPATVLGFWFGSEDEVDPRWFKRSGAFDQAIAQHFGAAVRAALAGRLDAWSAQPDGALALVLLLDQFTRNMYRGTPAAFAGDVRALALARALVDSGADLQLPPLRRWFAYMPLEHAEDAAVQQQCVRLFEALAGAAGPHREALASALDYARRHRDVIVRFGRFPHRNAILGRASSAEEKAFLLQPGSSF
ncbi:MAG: DUF924 family protein [Rubrivivax sp.]|nr:DUF924 family protein [Rubrivivax sp.]